MKKKPRIVIKLHLHGLALTSNGGDLPSRKSAESSQLGIKDLHTEDLSICNHLPQLSAQSFYFGKFRHMLLSKNFSAFYDLIFSVSRKINFFSKKLKKILTSIYKQRTEKNILHKKKKGEIFFIIPANGGG
jgi:hypothetical protein